MLHYAISCKNWKQEACQMSKSSEKAKQLMEVYSPVNRDSRQAKFKNAVYIIRLLN